MREIVKVMVAVLFCGCATETSSSLSFDLQNITPDSGYNKNPVNVDIGGKYFHPKVSQRLENGGGLQIDKTFSVVLVPKEASRSSVSLEQVTYIDEHMLAAQVPEGVQSGIYDVLVTDPYGATALLSSGYTAKECLGHGHCAGDTPWCDTDTSRCVECLADKDCSSGAPWCDTGSNSCVECLADDHCRDTDICTTSEQCNAGTCDVGSNDKESDGDGFVDAQCGGLDCDDSPAPGGCGADCHPDRYDVCDGIDNDCNAVTADGSGDAQLSSPCDGVDADLCEEGELECTGGVLVCSDLTGDILDVCDGIDNDCDPGTADGDEDPQFEAPCDGFDGDLCEEGVLECTAGALVCSDTTGDDMEGPYTDATCVDGVDNDCDGATDAPDTDCAYTWFNEDWAYRRKIVFDNFEQTEEALVDFPVYIALDNDWFAFNHLLSGFGEDIRFVAADDATELPYEVEGWHPGNHGDLWVNVPRIEAGSATDYIWMYYGNASAAAPINSEETWNSEFEAVYHFDGSSVDDSTANYFDAAEDLAHPATGHIGDGRAFYASHENDQINLGSNLEMLTSVSACTLSAWIFPWVLGGSEQYIIAVSIDNGGVPTTDSRATLGLSNESQLLAGGRSEDSAAFVYAESGAVITPNTAHYVVATLDYANDRIELYRNGVLVWTAEEEDADFTTPVTTGTPVTSVRIGSNDNGQGSFFDGILDEVRISKTARSANWIRAQYLSMTDSFVQFEDEEAKSALP